jgi:hypothetical protein
MGHFEVVNPNNRVVEPLADHHSCKKADL